MDWCRMDPASREKTRRKKLARLRRALRGEGQEMGGAAARNAAAVADDPMAALARRFLQLSPEEAGGATPCTSIPFLPSCLT